MDFKYCENVDFCVEKYRLEGNIKYEIVFIGDVCLFLYLIKCEIYD